MKWCQCWLTEHRNVAFFSRLHDGLISVQLWRSLETWLSPDRLDHQRVRKTTKSFSIRGRLEIGSKKRRFSERQSIWITVLVYLLTWELFVLQPVLWSLMDKVHLMAEVQVKQQALSSQNPVTNPDLKKKKKHITAAPLVNQSVRQVNQISNRKSGGKKSLQVWLEA